LTDSKTKVGNRGYFVQAAAQDFGQVETVVWLAFATLAGDVCDIFG
jgi:hypothetical protein